MNSKLNHIGNWQELSKQAKWSVFQLAELCGVNGRTLHRHFLRRMGKSPKAWLAEDRQRYGLELLNSGSSIKQTSAYLYYAQPTNFIRKFKKRWGVCPSRLLYSPNPAKNKLVRK